MSLPDLTPPRDGGKKAFYADPTRKPTVLAVNPDGISVILKDAPRWVLWKLVLKGGKWTKVPTQASGRNASSTNPKSWAAFPDVLPVYRGGTSDGFGFVLGGEFVGIDLDDVRDPATGELVSWAAELVSTAGTYAEVSPSGTGVKLFGFGTWGGKWHKRPHPSGVGEIEVYADGRFFVVTGHSATGTVAEVNDIQPALDRLAGLFAPPALTLYDEPPPPPPVVPAGSGCLLTDDELLDRIRDSKQGEKFARLWAGDTSDHAGDDSAADLALCGILAFWCGPDAGRIDRLFRRSGLMRDKWTARRGATTYGERTIDKALAGRSEFYDRDGRKSDSPDAASEGEPDDRPAIQVTTEEHQVNSAALAALARDPDVYQRGGLLVHVTHEPADGTLIRKPVAEPKVREFPKPLLREVFTRTARWEREVKAKGEVQTVPAHPPTWAVDAVHARGQWPGMRRLEAVITHPVLLRDGTVLSTNGYHLPSGLLVAMPSGLSVTVPDAPTPADVASAVETLLDPLTDFPFASPADRAAFLAALLTPLAWFAFDGPAPLFLIEANVRGAGKGLLADVVALTLLGRRFSPTTYTKDKDEMRKRITSLAVEGERMVLLDNLAEVVGGDVLDAALTADRWKDRVLGVNRTYDGPLHVTWFATGNNVQFRADTARRVCPIRLESPHERPELRDDLRYPNLRSHVLANRGRLLTAALTILRAYILAGRPKHGLEAWGSFEGWSETVREAVVFAGLPDPGHTRTALQTTADQDAVLMHTILDGLAVMDPERKGLTAAEIAGWLLAPGKRTACEEMKAAVEELCGKLDSAALAYKFRHFRRRNFGGRMLDAVTSGKHAARWRVCDTGGQAVRVDAPHPPDAPPHAMTDRGDGGHRGDDLHPPEADPRAEGFPAWADPTAFDALLVSRGKRMAEVVAVLNAGASAADPYPADAGFEETLTDHRKAAVAWLESFPMPESAGGKEGTKATMTLPSHQ